MSEHEAGNEPLINSFVQVIADVFHRHGQPPPPKNGSPGFFLVLLGLDGSGKTTVARKLCLLAQRTPRFRRVQYAHWRPGVLKEVAFPLPTSANIPRKAARPPGALPKATSLLRLSKNVFLTKLAWSMWIAKRLRNQTLVIVDRYYFNYFLDPISVKYYGPSWWLEKASQAYPRPDLVVVLRAPEATLRARKQELSKEHIEVQIKRLDQLAHKLPRCLVLDATRPADEIASDIMEKITGMERSKAGESPSSCSAQAGTLTP